jgi:hypothetical protein
MRMLRNSHWKLVRYLRAPERDELFNLASDLEESVNEIENPEYTNIVSDLHAKIARQMTVTTDPALALLKN